MSFQTYLGDNYSADYDGHKFILISGNGRSEFCMTIHAMLELETFVRDLRTNIGKSLSEIKEEEADVWHEGSKKFYRAKLIRELTIDEVFDHVAKT